MMLKVFEEFIKNDIDPFGEEDWNEYDYKKLFIKFLKDNDAYDKFVENIKIYSTHRFKTIGEYLNFVDTYNDKLIYLNGSFIFTKTKENGDYWYSLVDMWKHKLKSIS